MHCAGFNSDTYDRYVLGLLEEPDRSQLETQIQEQCPACLTGVQRSMNLWLVFAETLENAEPSEDFRGRIVRIAELSRKVLTFPKNSAVRERSSVPISTLVIICAVTCILLVATWYAARSSARINRPSSTPDVERLAQDLASTQLKLEQEIERRQKAEEETGSSGRAAIQKSKTQDDLLTQAQAQVEQYKTALERNRQQLSANTSLLDTFAKTGARLLPMKATEAAVKGLGYAIFAQNSRLVFVGSNLPKPSKDHTFQLWVLRKEAPLEVSAGVFMPSDSGPWVVQYDDASLLSNVIGIEVTEEPAQGEYTKPSGPKIFEASTVEED
jgi:anti-sigma-K factor RskA